MYGQNLESAKDRNGMYVVTNPTYQQGIQYQQNIQADLYQNPYPQNTFMVQTGQPIIYTQPIVQGQPLTSVQYTNVMGQNVDHQQSAFIVVAQPAAFEIEENHDRLPSRVKSRHPREIKCSVCHRRGVTTTKNAIGGGTWTVALALFCCGCWPCAIIPCFMKDCMDVKHSCPNCGAEAGVNRYLFDD